ncbi:MAG: hypothetical protein R6X02_08940 [Enhygromyxa sp.]
MQAKRGRIENGAVVLIDHNDIPEGTEVVVLVPDGEQPVYPTDEELAVIDAGLAEARRPERIDARAFLRELRLGR